MAEMMVMRQNGEQVLLRLWRVDRRRQRVGFDLPEYNARLVFTNVGGHIQIISETDRRPLDSERPAILHVSKSVYRNLARWAGSILNSRRQAKEEET